MCHRSLEKCMQLKRLAVRARICAKRDISLKGTPRLGKAIQQNVCQAWRKRLWHPGIRKRYIAIRWAQHKFFKIFYPTSLSLALLHAYFRMPSKVYEMSHHFSYLVELLCSLICLSLALNYCLPLTVASTIPVFFPSSNRTQQLAVQSVAASMPLNASAPREYTCSGFLYGLEPNEVSCIDAVRQLDGRDGKEKIWKQRGFMANYDIGLPRSYWSCTSESHWISSRFH